MLLGTLVGIGGCDAAGPDISGFALANTRFVKSGEKVTLSSPLTKNGEQQWRVETMDPAHLARINPPRVAQSSDGTSEIVIDARAKKPGLTKVVFVEANPAQGQTARRVRFRIRVFD